MVDFTSLASCADLTPEAAEEAARSAAAMKTLLARAAEISRPDDGCPKILLAVARLADKDWVEGELRIELTGDDASTTISVLADHGFGIVEHALPSVRLAAPLDEFVRAVELARHLVEPFVPIVGDGTLVLAQPADDGEGDRWSIEIHHASLAEAPSPNDATTAPPPATTSEAPARVSHVAERGAQDEDVVVPAAAANGEVRSKVAANVHTRPTRRMTALDPEIIRAATGKADPRREDD